MLQPKPPKPKKCRARGCGVLFPPQRMGQRVCSPTCGLTVARAIREQEDQRKRSDERKADRARREKLKTRSDYMKDAQREFNSYIRARDRGAPCICCGKPLGDGEVGGAFDCGHFRSVGSAPHLRFHEDNAHGQRKYCNRYRAGNAVEYRAGLVQRIGLERVVALEADQSPKHYTIEDLKQIIATYRAKTRELLKESV